MGLAYNTRQGTVSIPEKKLEKGAHLVLLPCFDGGEERIPLIEVQGLHGNAVYYRAVQPALRPELGAISALLRQARRGDPYVCPVGEPEEVKRTFEEFWDSLELMRVLLSRPAAWAETFANSL